MPSLETFTSELFDTIAGYLTSQPSEGVASALEALDVPVPSAVAKVIADAVTDGGGTYNIVQSGSPSITLGALLNPFFDTNTGITLPSTLSGVALTQLSFTYTTSPKSFTIAGSVTVPLNMASASVNWNMSLSLTCEITSLSPITTSTSGFLQGDSQGQGRSTSISLTGTYTFGAGSQVFTVGLPEGTTVSTSLSTMCSVFGLTLPAYSSDLPTISFTTFTMSLDLSQSQVTWQVVAQYSLSTGSVSSSSTTAFVTVAEIDSNWVFTCGCALGTNIDLSSTPIVQIFCSGAPPLTLSAAMLVISTGPVSNLAIPAIFGTSTPFQNFTINPVAGVSVAAVLDLTDGVQAGGVAASLAKVNNPPVTSGPAPSNPTVFLLEAQIASTAVNSSLTAEIGRRNIYGYAMDLTLTIGGNPFGIAFSGQVGPILNNLNFTLSLNVTETQLAGTLTANATDPIQLTKIPGVWLDSMEGVLGINFVLAQVVAGFMCQFNIGSTAQNPGGAAPSGSALNGLLPTTTGPGTAKQLPMLPNTNTCALVLAVDADLIPDVNLGLLYADSIKLVDLVNAMMPTTKPSTDFLNAMSQMTFNDILIYVCLSSPPGFLSNVTLPYGAALPAGTAFEIQGQFLYNNHFTLWASLSVSITAGTIAGSLYCSPITIDDILTITQGTGQSFPAPGGFALDKGVKTGGAFICFNSAGSPDYLSANWDVKFYEIESSLDVAISENTFTFTFAANTSTAFIGEIECSLTLESPVPPAVAQFTATLNGSLNCNVTLPPVCGLDLFPNGLNVTASDLAVGLSISASASGVSVSVTGGSFTFQNYSLSIPSFDLTVNPTSLEDLADQVVDHVVANAASIFDPALSALAGLLHQYGDDAKNYLNTIDAGLHDIVEFFGGQHASRHAAVAPWLVNGALVAQEGTSSPVYMVYNYQLRLVPPDPDMTTFNALCVQLTAAKKSDTVNQVPTLAWPSLKLDPSVTNTDPNNPTIFVQLPSRVNGTVFTLDSTSASKTIYISVAVDATAANGTAKYAIQDTDAFNAACSAGVVPAPIIQGSPCNVADIAFVPNNPLAANCVINGVGQMEYSVFLDGIRCVLPSNDGNKTKNTLKTGLSSSILPEFAYSAIPAMANPGSNPATEYIFPTLAPNDLVTCTALNSNTYVVLTDQNNSALQALHQVTQAQIQADFSTSTITNLAENLFNVLQINAAYNP